MRINSFKVIYFLAVSAIFLACSKENTDVPVNPLDGLIKLNEGYAIGASVKAEIWGEKNFYVGYNKLFVVLYDSLNLTDKITDAHIHFMPVMTMGTGESAMQDGTPVENPEERALNGAFGGAIVFTMPTTTGGVWQLGVSVHNHKTGKEGEAEFDIAVDSPIPSVSTVFISKPPDNRELVLSLSQPEIPKVGINDIEFTIHKEVTMMDWQSDDSYTIEITPEMPAMGHGSTDNINPVSKGNGHYKGKVNLISPGEWKVNVLVKKDGVAVSENLFFTLTL